MRECENVKIILVVVVVVVFYSGRVRQHSLSEYYNIYIIYIKYI